MFRYIFPCLIMVGQYVEADGSGFSGESCAAPIVNDATYLDGAYFTPHRVGVYKVRAGNLDAGGVAPSTYCFESFGELQPQLLRRVPLTRFAACPPPPSVTDL